MTVEEMKALFERFAELPWNEFKNIPNKPHHVKDIAAMILLDRLCPGEHDMVVATEHDEIWFAADPETVAKDATEDDIHILRACGVNFFDDSFHMFV